MIKLNDNSRLLSDRDKEWEDILKLCEDSKEWEVLADLQSLVDNTFDLLDGLHKARKSLTEALASLERLGSDMAESYGQEWEVVDTLIDDIKVREIWATREYFRLLDKLLG
jgi:hypothetical protein